MNVRGVTSAPQAGGSSGRDGFLLAKALFASNAVDTAGFDGPEIATLSRTVTDQPSLLNAMLMSIVRLPF